MTFLKPRVRNFPKRKSLTSLPPRLPSIAGTGSRSRFVCRRRSKARKRQLRLNLFACFAKESRCWSRHANVKQVQKPVRKKIINALGRLNAANITKPLICRGFSACPDLAPMTLRYTTTETNGTNMVVFLKRLSIPGSAKASLAVKTVEKNQPKYRVRGEHEWPNP